MVGDDPVSICRENKKIAKLSNRDDLERIWSVAELVLERYSIKLPKLEKTKEELLKIKDNYQKIGQHLSWRRCKRARRKLKELEETKENNTTTPSQVYWGFHPFGVELVQNLYVAIEVFYINILRKDSIIVKRLGISKLLRYFLVSFDLLMMLM